MPDGTIDAETTRLAIQAKGGDADAFCALVDLHQRTARRLARTALGSDTEADDAVQEACITAWQRIGSLDDPAAFRAWLLSITWRKALDRRRSVTRWLKRVVERSNSNAAQDSRTPDMVIESVTDTARLADEELVMRERDDIVAQMIRSLPARLRDPFLLATAGEHRYEDIASMLRIPVGTVKWRVSEARRVLREKLARIGMGKEAGPRRPRQDA